MITTWIKFWMPVCLLAYLQMAHAALGSTPDLPTLINEADVVCVAKITNVKSLDRTKIEVIHKDRNGNAVTMDAQNAIADIAVESVLKGKMEQASSQVTFFQYVRSPGNPDPYTKLVSGETEMLFLTATENKAVFALTEPLSRGRSKISLGAAKIISPPSDLTPLRAVLLTLTEALTGNDKPVILDCLNRLRVMSGLLYLKSGIYSEEYNVKSRLALEEPLFTEKSAASSLESFVKTQILPAILKLTKDADSDVSDQAIIIAGSLQDVSFIPALVKIADKRFKPDELGYAASAIGEYKNPDAVIPLIQVLHSSNFHVREQAIYALRELNNPLALPFLLERLDEESSDVRVAVNHALFEITGEDSTHLPSGDAQSLPAREDAFWKKWEAEHQERLKALRAQFDAAPPAKTIP